MQESTEDIVSFSSVYFLAYPISSDLSQPLVGSRGWTPRLKSARRDSWYPLNVQLTPSDASFGKTNCNKLTKRK